MIFELFGPGTERSFPHCQTKPLAQQPNSPAAQQPNNPTVGAKFRVAIVVIGGSPGQSAISDDEEEDLESHGRFVHATTLQIRYTLGRGDPRTGASFDMSQPR